MRSAMRLGSALLLAGFMALVMASERSMANERAALDSIRRDVLAVPGQGDAHPLPLAAQWNVGAWPGSFDPDFQVNEIRDGRYLLPTFNLEPPDARLKPEYFTSATQYLAHEKVPLSFISLQWEMVLPKVSSAYPAKDAKGETAAVSPFGPRDPWYAAGRAWGESPTLKRMQELYPDPPFVLFVSNNEHPKMGWRELAKTPELLSRTGPNPSDDTVRRVVGDAWVERYDLLIRGFREALTQSAWRERAIFAGYNSFSQPAAGRWWGWVDYSIHSAGRMEPWSRTWQGASVSYYVHDWAADSDFTVWSPQIEAMNWVPVLAQVLQTKPQWWFELSTWDGQTPGSTKDKALFYKDRGQTFTPPRFAGSTQFGMWLLRPRVVREFRGTRDDRVRFGSYFNETLNAVARVHDNPVLSRFWRGGRLVANPSNAHPYQENLPTDFASSARWFLLDSPLNPARPWRLDTQIEVYALALQLGDGASAEWLVYAFAPRRDLVMAEVQIPNGPRTTVRASTAGCFTCVDRKDAELVTCGSAAVPMPPGGIKLNTPGSR